MLPAADEPRLASPANPPIPPAHHSSPYLPESTKRRRLMIVSVALVCLGLLGPHLIDLELVGDSWQIQKVYWNAATELKFGAIHASHITIGLGTLLIASALFWGRGLRHAGWLKLVIVLSIPIMTTLGLTGLLVIAIMTSGGTHPDRQTHIIWTYFLAYPAAIVAFLLGIGFGTRRA